MSEAQDTDGFPDRFVARVERNDSSDEHGATVRRVRLSPQGYPDGVGPEVRVLMPAGMDLYWRDIVVVERIDGILIARR